MLKAIHLPHCRSALYRLVQELWAGYGPAGAPLLPAVVRQLGCLMLARVDGKSPAEYLTEHGRRVARQVGRGLLQGDAAGLDPVMQAVQQADPGLGSA